MPGHHLQYSIVEEIPDVPAGRRWDIYPVFSEGWGLYAETIGGELGLYKDPYSKYGQLTNEMPLTPALSRRAPGGRGRSTCVTFQSISSMSDFSRLLYTL